MTISGLAESLKTMIWPNPTKPWPNVTLIDGLFLGSRAFVLSKLAINIFNSLETMHFSET